VAPTIVRTIPHDPSASTQGLAFSDGELFESTGGHGTSTLRRLNVADGSVLASVPINGDFAEGIAVSGGLLHQLSWMSGRVRRFKLPTLEAAGGRSYRGQGWGLCKGPQSLIMSDGSGTLQFVDDEFQLLAKLPVTLNRLPTRRLNDLEYDGASLYANIWFRSDILEICPDDGRVIRIVDCSALQSMVGPVEAEHTLNGIAYNPVSGTFFLTGKCWNTMFEVALPRHD
jgi:glutamine cyclotransferase